MAITVQNAQAESTFSERNGQKREQKSAFEEEKQLQQPNEYLRALCNSTSKFPLEFAHTND